MLRPEAADPRAFSRRGASRVAFLVGLPVILEALLAWRLLGPLEHTLFPDDAFLYLCVGRNIADGFGPTFDGVHATTGFQPLWQAIVALVALGPFEPSTLTSAVAAVNLACLAGAVTMVAVAFRRRGLLPGVWALVVLVAFANPYFLKTSLNGMKSGLVWLFWSLAMIVLTRLLEGHTGVMDAPIAGAVAGAAVLTRLDGIGLVFALAWVTAKASIGHSARRRRSSPRPASWPDPISRGCGIRFGHWLPVSVLVKSGYAETNALAVAILGALFAAGVVLVTHRARLGRGDVVVLRPAPAAAAALAILAGLLPLAMYAMVSRCDSRTSGTTRRCDRLSDAGVAHRVSAVGARPSTSGGGRSCRRSRARGRRLDPASCGPSR